MTDAIPIGKPQRRKGLTYEIYPDCPSQLMRRPLILRQRCSLFTASFSRETRLVLEFPEYDIGDDAVSLQSR